MTANSNSPEKVFIFKKIIQSFFLLIVLLLTPLIIKFLIYYFSPEQTLERNYQNALAKKQCGKALTYWLQFGSQYNLGEIKFIDPLATAQSNGKEASKIQNKLRTAEFYFYSPPGMMFSYLNFPPFFQAVNGGFPDFSKKQLEKISTPITNCTNITQATILYKELSDQGLAYASNTLAIIFFNQGDHTNAINFLKKALTQSNTIAYDIPNEYSNKFQAMKALSWIGIYGDELESLDGESAISIDKYFANAYEEITRNIFLINLPNQDKSSTNWILTLADSMRATYVFALENIASNALFNQDKTKKNYQEAAHYLENYTTICLNKNDLCSQDLLKDLPLLYLQGGYGLEKNCGKAFYWFNQELPILNQANSKLLYEIFGDLESQGNCVQQNLVAAFNYYLAAAKLGSPTAQTKVGYCYLSGTGVISDPIQAYAWLSTAKTSNPQKTNMINTMIFQAAIGLGEGKRGFDNLDQAKQLADQYYQKYVVPFN